MHHVASLLEEYKLKVGRGSYPSASGVQRSDGRVAAHGLLG